MLFKAIISFLAITLFLCLPGTSFFLNTDVTTPSYLSLCFFVVAFGFSILANAKLRIFLYATALSLVTFIVFLLWQKWSTVVYVLYGLLLLVAFVFIVILEANWQRRDRKRVLFKNPQ